jgi:hypothetical protein
LHLQAAKLQMNTPMDNYRACDSPSGEHRRSPGFADNNACGALALPQIQKSSMLEQ